MSFKSKGAVALLVIIALGLPLLIKGPDGRPIMTIDDWIPDVPSDVLQPLASGFSSSDRAAADAPTAFGSPDQHDDAKGFNAAPVMGKKMYKWQDDQGRWHFSNEKPENGELVSEEALPEVENVMEAPVKKGGGGFVLPGGFSFGAD